MNHTMLITGALVLFVGSGRSASANETEPSPRPGRAGGDITVEDTSPNAFGYPAPGLSRRERRRFLVGNSFFKQNWIESPASATERDGLGPLFNARSCSACHLRDGRSAPPEADDRSRHGLLIRIGERVDGGGDDPHPIYGGQIQDVGVLGTKAEAVVRIDYEPVPGTFGDGTPFELLKPRYSLEGAAYGDPGPGTVLGPRTAPALVGLGLLEAVPLSTLEELSDPTDRDADGISGRIHYLDASQRVVGRFGWKATQPTVRDQVAAAFVNDMGITSSLFPHEVVTDAQRTTIAVVEGSPEIREETFEKVVFYTAALAVPAQRDPRSNAALRGQQLFGEMGCASCHTPTLVTGMKAFHPKYTEQRIHAYTDLLLHDMGPGLMDEKRDGDASPAEWRTPPLWGIGLVETVNGHTRFLHDGRARDLSEAILWHGGESGASRERYRAASSEDRATLLAFLESL